MEEPLLVLTIDLGNNIKDNITIYPKANLADLALQFCKDNGLNPLIQSSIQAYLEESLKSVRQKDQVPRPGVRLYAAGVEKLKKKEQEREILKEKRQKKEMEGLTFQPKINRSGKKPRVASSRNIRKQITPEYEECTFTPTISSHSKALASRKVYPNVYRRLYKKPKDNSANPVENNEKISIPMEFICKSVERLHKVTPKTKKEEDLTGLFTPNVGRSPRMKRPNDVFSHLYCSRSSSSNLNDISPIKLTSANPKSSRIFDKLKEKRFRQIFNLFEPQNGLISCQKTDKIDEDLRKVLNPLIEEMQEYEDGLSYQEFTGALDALMRLLTPEERHLLVFPKKEKEEVLEVKKARKKPSDIYSRLVEQRSKIQDKLEAARKEKELKEMAECSFRPNSSRSFILM